MKVVIFDNEGTEKIISHFMAYGYEDFIFFNKHNVIIDHAYFKLNDIDVVELASFSQESTREMLNKIRGSLKDSFFVVYSSAIGDFDLDVVLKAHKSSQKTVTVIEKNRRLCAAILEEELFDYLNGAKSLEKEALLRIAEDDELGIYKEKILAE